MATLTLRRVKGSALTYDEADDNFENLNNELIALGIDVDQINIDIDALEAPTFETFNKNIKSNAYTLNYTGDTLTSIAYSGGITKTFNYTGDKLTSIVFTGITGNTTKTLNYTGDTLTSVAYS